MKFHNIKAVAMNARNASAFHGFKTNCREKLARVKVFIDIVTNKQPKFLGEAVEIKKTERMDRIKQNRQR